MSTQPQRKNYIDVLRGMVMVIMLLDHVRDYFHGSEIDPMDLEHTTPYLFFTRWITHFCAPVFIFLSGVSGWLQLAKYKQKGTARFFIKRGLFFILMEWTVIALAWTFDPGFHFIPFQVIWAIGVSMLLLGLILYTGLKDKYILVLGLLIVVLHNLLDKVEAQPGFDSNFWLDLIHNGRFSAYHFTETRIMVIVYPFLPWLGLMMVGFGMGRIFGHEQTAQSRRKLLFLLSGISIALFIVLRAPNIYGNLYEWQADDNWLKSLMSFLDVRKYPPSLQYMLITIGPALFVLALLENIENRLTRALSVYGRTAFFFYIVHIYTIHFVAMVFYFLRGHTMGELQAIENNGPFLFTVRGEGFGLVGVYIVWASIALGLYPLCVWYDGYKRANPEKTWLRYF